MAIAWNDLIRRFLDDDHAPFFQRVRDLVTRHRYVRGKNEGELIRMYGIMPEDLASDFILDLIRGRFFLVWENLGLSDNDIEIRIRQMIKQRIIRAYQRQKTKPATDSIDDDQFGDTIADRTVLSIDLNAVFKLAREQLTERQIHVLHGSPVFQAGGDLTNHELAKKLGCSEPTIERDVRHVKDVLKEVISPFLSAEIRREYGT